MIMKTIKKSRLKKLLNTFIENSLTYDDDYAMCKYCYRDSLRLSMILHADDCPVMDAVILLKELDE